MHSVRCRNVLFAPGLAGKAEEIGQQVPHCKHQNQNCQDQQAEVDSSGVHALDLGRFRIGYILAEVALPCQRGA
jgi:hypothetical protein